MQRLKLCLSILIVSVLAACGPADSNGDPGETPGEVDVTITINNEGASAWLVTAVTDEGVARTDVSNPTWSLEQGKRYRVVNNGGSAHPFALRDSDDQDLFSQQAGKTGSLEADPDIDYVEDGEGVTFTFTATLASQVGLYYICALHPPMRGNIRTVF